MQIKYKSETAHRNNDRDLVTIEMPWQPHKGFKMLACVHLLTAALFFHFVESLPNIISIFLFVTILRNHRKVKTN